MANAVFDATGARLRRLPFTPDTVKVEMDKAKHGWELIKRSYDVGLDFLEAT